MSTKNSTDNTSTLALFGNLSLTATGKARSGIVRQLTEADIVREYTTCVTAKNGDKPAHKNPFSACMAVLLSLKGTPKLSQSEFLALKKAAGLVTQQTVAQAFQGAVNLKVTRTANWHEKGLTSDASEISEKVSATGYVPLLKAEQAKRAPEIVLQFKKQAKGLCEKCDKAHEAGHWDADTRLEAEKAAGRIQERFNTFCKDVAKIGVKVEPTLPWTGTLWECIESKLQIEMKKSAKEALRETRNRERAKKAEAKRLAAKRAHAASMVKTKRMESQIEGLVKASNGDHKKDGEIAGSAHEANFVANRQ